MSKTGQIIVTHFKTSATWATEETLDSGSNQDHVNVTVMVGLWSRIGRAILGMF